MKIEIVVYNIESAIQAEKGGADRIELCDNPGEGGTTPSAGVIEQVRKKLSIEVYVMIRPRGGDFFYSEDEFASMQKDIELCKQLNVEGVVFGILTTDGRINTEQCKILIDQARPLKVTCHRAFDVTRDPSEAMEDCIEAGFDRILTSGQQPQAVRGVDLIAQLVKKSNERIIIMPGSGVNEETVGEIVSKTGAKEIHFSAKRFVNSKNTRYNSAIGFTESLPDDRGNWIVDASTIQRIRGKIQK